MNCLFMEQSGHVYAPAAIDRIKKRQRAFPPGATLICHSLVINNGEDPGNENPRDNIGLQFV